MKPRALIVLFASLLVASADAQDSAPIAQAQAAASAWMVLVDDGHYSESWKQAADVFRSGISEQSWVKAIDKVRSPLGSVKSRQVLSSNFTRTLPGAPDGDYVVIKYKAQFENKASAIETVTPLRGTDGLWRVSGYYIK